MSDTDILLEAYENKEEFYTLTPSEAVELGQKANKGILKTALSISAWEIPVMAVTGTAAYFLCAYVIPSEIQPVLTKGIRLVIGFLAGGWCGHVTGEIKSYQYSEAKRAARHMLKKGERPVAAICGLKEMSPKDSRVISITPNSQLVP